MRDSNSKRARERINYEWLLNAYGREMTNTKEIC